MTFFIFLIYILGIKPPLMTRLVARESLSGSNLRMLEKFFLVVVGFTFMFEFFGP